MSRLEIEIPTLHVDQVNAWDVWSANRFSALRCGRRWGKTIYGEAIACDCVAKGQIIGWFAPEYKVSSETYQEVRAILDPIISRSSQTAGVIRTIGSGRMDFWTLENERAGRSRKYHGIIIDEAAFTKPNMMDIWEKSIRPTLLDYKGWALVMSNTNGDDPENFFWSICNQPERGFAIYHAPTHNNPHLPPEELEKLERDHPPLVYRQEYLAEFVDWSGAAFFALSKLLVNDQPVAYPSVCDTVFATIDTATKTGKENDGTAVVYWAYSKSKYEAGLAPLVCLDWDYIQIEGSFLETWLPNIFKRLEELARTCRARRGSIGAWIEDKSSGMVLLQNAARKGWPARAIDSKLTSLGKSERAINISGFVHQEKIKLSETAYNRTLIYKGVSRNHLVSQVIGFRVGNKDQVDDDLLDCFTYGAAIALGNSEGF